MSPLGRWWPEILHGWLSKERWSNMRDNITGELLSSMMVILKTSAHLFMETGFTDIWFRRVGRIPALAKNMIVVVKKT
jgi:hypothetical protein